MAQKAFPVMFVLAIATLFGAAVIFNSSYEGFDVTLSIDDVSIKGNGVYGITAHAIIENANDYDIALYSIELDVYEDNSLDWLIFSYATYETTEIKAGESYTTDSITGELSLQDDNIPDRVYIVVDNFRYMVDGRTYDESWETYYDVDLSEYLP